jgi:DNA-directed RNA polymerase subunit M/transcription elongation factor TFIIS
MVMWKARKCPKCNGDMYVDIDEDTWFDHCLQCGYMRSISKSSVLCPKCGEDITDNSIGDGRIYHCDHCGSNIEFCHSAG